MKKPREFYLYTANRGMFYGLENEKTWDDDIHVIEKQAYIKAIEALKLVDKWMSGLPAYPQKAHETLKELGEL